MKIKKFAKEDDRVLELAVNGSAGAIVTFNQKDFSGSERFGIEVYTPGFYYKNYLKGEEK